MCRCRASSPLRRSADRCTPQMKTLAGAPGFYGTGFPARSVLRNHRRCIEVIVQAGAEDMLVHLGAVGRGDRGSEGGENKASRRSAEVDIEVLGLGRPVVAEQTDEEGER